MKIRGNTVGTTLPKPNLDQTDPTKGDYIKGDRSSIKGAKGDKGDKGDPGAPGYTPVKGEDYFTEADKTDLINSILGALPDLDGVSY